MMVLGGRCFMLLLMFPSNLVCSCMMLASLGGGVSNTFDDWMG
jgi:hypothetical protein